jgi:hypothetical protein
MCLSLDILGPGNILNTLAGFAAEKLQDGVTCHISSISGLEEHLCSGEFIMSLHPFASWYSDRYFTKVSSFLL